MIVVNTKERLTTTTQQNWLDKNPPQAHLPDPNARPIDTWDSAKEKSRYQPTALVPTESRPTR